MPQGRHPRGEVHQSDLRFSWNWTGPEVIWELVLLDEDFLESGRMIELRGETAELNTAMRRLVLDGRARYWCVESELEGQRFRSLPEEFLLAR